MKNNRIVRSVASVALFCALGTAHGQTKTSDGEALAWMRFEKNTESYAGTPYLWLGRYEIELKIEAAPAPGRVLDLLWGSKRDTRTAVIVINGKSQTVEAGGYDGFRWKRVPLPAGLEGDRYQVSIKAGAGKAAFIAAVQLTDPAGKEAEQPAKEAARHVTLATKAILPPAASASGGTTYVPGEEILAQLPNDPLERSAAIAGYSLSKVQRWLHEVALTKIDPETKLYISHSRGSGRYREALWNYDDAAADTYPFLFWAAWYTDIDKINGPILDVLKAEQRICNHLDRIPTAVNHKTLEKVVKSKDNLVFAASEYVKDGLIAIVEVSGKDTPWFERMRAIEDDIWKHADIDTPYGKIPTKNLEANGEQIQALARLYTATGEEKYLDWAERLADYYLSPGTFVPHKLRDHGCEIVGGLGLLLGVESVHRPKKAAFYLPLIRKMLDEILKRGTNEDGLMLNSLDAKRGLSDGWGYNYVGFLCYDMAAGRPLYREGLEQTLRNLGKPRYRNGWGNGQGGNIDEVADSIEGGLYLLNRLPVPEGLGWADREMAGNVTRMGAPLATAPLWTTYKLESNGVRTVLIHALMHTRGLVARPWQQGLKLGARQTKGGLEILLESDSAYEGKLVFDIPRHRLYMGFKQDWPRMNTMPEWFTVEPDKEYAVADSATGAKATHSGQQLHDGLPIALQAGKKLTLVVK